MWLTFRKDILTEEHLHSLGLNERQARAALCVKEKGRVTNAVYQQLCKVSKRTASYELGELEAKGLLERVGTMGKGTYYRVKGEEKERKGQQRGKKGAKVSKS